MVEVRGQLALMKAVGGLEYGTVREPEYGTIGGYGGIWFCYQS